MKSFLAIIVFLLLVIKVIEGLPLSEFQGNSQSLERRVDSTRGSGSPTLLNKRRVATATELGVEELDLGTPDF